MQQALHAKFFKMIQEDNAHDISEERREEARGESRRYELQSIKTLVEAIRVPSSP